MQREYCTHWTFVYFLATFWLVRDRAEHVRRCVHTHGFDNGKTAASSPLDPLMQIANRFWCADERLRLRLISCLSERVVHFVF